ncbi:MAG: hypothetical protein HYZ68_03235 [Chloroflexi bacterium]|nr:hypothetical protein [Chloroflexota bacterium]
MYLDSGHSREQTWHQGVIYHLCCEGCRRLFEAQPEIYLAEPGETGAKRVSSNALRLGGEALQDLSPQARTLAAHCFACPGACQALEHLYQHPRTTMSLEDWAYHLGRPEKEIANALHALEELTLAERLQVGGLIFYRLTPLREQRRTIEEFLVWRRKWAFQLSTLGDMFKIELGKEGTWSAIPSAG